ncbi:hypothetical protein DMH88_14380 [Escherichia coli]|nr:hypothetical protein [Escherichia coli]
MKDEILGYRKKKSAIWQHFTTPQGNGRSRSFWRDFLLMLPLFPALALRVKRRYTFGIETAADVTRRSVSK